MCALVFQVLSSPCPVRERLKRNETTSHQRRLSSPLQWLIFTPFNSGVAPPGVCVPWINNTNLPVEIPEHYSHLGSGFSQPWIYEKHDKALSLSVFKPVWEYVTCAQPSTATPNLLHFCPPIITRHGQLPRSRCNSKEFLYANLQA